MPRETLLETKVWIKFSGSIANQAKQFYAAVQKLKLHRKNNGEVGAGL